MTNENLDKIIITGVFIFTLLLGFYVGLSVGFPSFDFFIIGFIYIVSVCFALKWKTSEKVEDAK